MRSLSDQLTEAGFNLSEKDQIKVRESLKEIKKTFNKKLTCKYCHDEIQFIGHKDRHIPHNLDGEPHWQTCPYSTFFQKKMSFNIMKKLAVFFTLKHGPKFEKDTALTLAEVKVIHAVLEKEFRSRPDLPIDNEAKVIQCDSEEEVVNTIKKVYEDNSGEIAGEIQFKPIPTDPIGDPDEDRAPPEQDIPDSPETILSL